MQRQGWPWPGHKDGRKGHRSPRPRSSFSVDLAGTFPFTSPGSSTSCGMCPRHFLYSVPRRQEVRQTPTICPPPPPYSKTTNHVLVCGEQLGSRHMKWQGRLGQGS